MADPLFSIVIPTYGRAELLELAVASVLRQSIEDFEVIVVDDGNSGLTARFSDPRCRIVPRLVQGGAAAARNDGIRAAQGRFVTFLDDDDEFTPDRLAIALAGLRSAPVALCWKANLGNGALNWGRNLSGVVAGTMLEGPVPQVGSAAIRRDAVLLMDETFQVSEDVEWWLRMSRSVPVHTITEVGYLFRDHSGERLTARTADRFEARLKLLQQHREYFEEHRSAAAYQWLRAGGLADAAGRPVESLCCFVASFRSHPSPRPLAHASRVAIPALAQAVGRRR